MPLIKHKDIGTITALLSYFITAFLLKCEGEKKDRNLLFLLKSFFSRATVDLEDVSFKRKLRKRPAVITGVHLHGLVRCISLI
jgi:hypothetical protein